MRSPPVFYSPEIADRICAELESGRSLIAVCRADEMPSEMTVRRWAKENEDFASKYARAREIGYARLAEEILEIADDGRNDWVERESRNGETYTVLNDEHVRRSQLRVESRKWLLSKMLPKQFGAKITVETPEAPKTREALLAEIEQAKKDAGLE